VIIENIARTAKSVEPTSVKSKEEREPGKQLLDAARSDNSDALATLLQRQDLATFINYQDDSGWTALSLAARNGHENIVRLLLGKGATPNQQLGVRRTTLIDAAMHGHTGIVGLLLKNGADPNVASQDGWTALMWAADGGHVNTVRLLMESSDLFLRNTYQQTAWDLASDASRLQIAEELRVAMELRRPGKGPSRNR
jgi:ankyrin repeat protein